MPRFYIRTYGCQMNDRDSKLVSHSLEKKGYLEVKSAEDADVILINTCSVRDSAEKKALGAMGMYRRMKKKRPEIVLGFLGCMAQSKGDNLLKQTNVDLVVGTQKYHKVVDYVEEIIQKRQEQRINSLKTSIVDVEEEKDSQNTITSQKTTRGQVTAFVSIMQGCKMKCSFCIVPQTRGSERSRPISHIVDEVKKLVNSGIKEVTLLGQIVNLYGRHEFPAKDGKSPFVQLLENVHKVSGIKRIRFTSPHPVGYKDDLINSFSYLPRLANHIHLPLQSGSPAILKKMKRPYSTDKFLEICEKTRLVRPTIGITTDIIVGYPGETDEDFEQTCDIVKKANFDNAFIFRYSKRANTPASDDPNQVEDYVKKERNQILLKIIDELAKEKTKKLIGKECEILCEGTSKTNSEKLMGRTGENKIVVFEGNESCIGSLFKVKIVESTIHTLYGVPVESKYRTSVLN